MANRYFRNDGYRCDPGMVEVSCRVTTDASGNIVAGSQVGAGSFCSITKTGVGAYRVTLTDPYIDYYNATVTLGFVSTASPTALYTAVGTISIGPSVANPTFDFLTLNNTATPTNVAVACVFSINIELKNSAAG